MSRFFPEMHYNVTVSKYEKIMTKQIQNPIFLPSTEAFHSKRVSWNIYFPRLSEYRLMTASENKLIHVFPKHSLSLNILEN